MPRPGRLDNDAISGLSWIVRHCLASIGHQDQNDELFAPTRLYEINVLIIQYARVVFPVVLTMTPGGTEIGSKRLNDQISVRVYEAFQQSISQRIGCRFLPRGVGHHDWRRPCSFLQPVPVECL